MTTATRSATVVRSQLCKRSLHSQCISEACRCECHGGSTIRPARAEADATRQRSRAQSMTPPNPRDDGRTMTTAINLEFGGAPKIGGGPGRTAEWIDVLRVIAANIEGFTEQPGVWAKVKRYEKLATAKNVATLLAKFRAWAEQQDRTEGDGLGEPGAWEFVAERLSSGKDSAGQLWVRYNPEPKRP